MSVQTQIDRLETAKEAIATAIAGKGVTVPSGTKLDGMAGLIESITASGGTADENAPSAIGSFTLASDVKGDSTTVITVTGLPFAPKNVLIVPRWAGWSSVSTNYYTILAVHRTESSKGWAGAYNSNNSSYGFASYLDEAMASIVFTSDGFTLSGTGTTNYSAPHFRLGEYIYIAVG